MGRGLPDFCVYVSLNGPVQGTAFAFLRYGCLQRSGDAWPLDLLWELEACVGARA